MKQLHDSPFAVLDHIAGYAPLCQKLSSAKSNDEVKAITELFVKEYKVILDKYPEITSTRTKARISFALGSAIATHGEESALTPSEVIMSALDVVLKTALDNADISQVTDVPMENGFWAVELASKVEPLFRKVQFTDDQMTQIRLHLCNAFNEVIEFASNVSVISEERTKNTISTDIGVRMEEALRHATSGGTTISDDQLKMALAEFNKIMEGYYQWIKAVEGNL